MQPKPMVFTVEPEVKVRLIAQGDCLCAIANIATPKGPITVAAHVNVRTVRALVARYLAARAGVPFETSGKFGKKIGKVAKKVAKARVLRKVLASVDDVAKNPAIAKAVGLAAMAYPPVGVPVATVLAARKAYDKSSKILKRAKAKDPAARAFVNDIARGACAGNPKAVRTAKILAITKRYQDAIGKPCPVPATAAGLHVGAADWEIQGGAYPSIGHEDIMGGGYPSIGFDWDWGTAGITSEDTYRHARRHGGC